MTHTPRSAPSGATASDMQRLLAAELSTPSRLRYTMLFLVGLAGAGVAAALVATEAGLPVRTQASLLVLTGMGLSWSAFAAWVLVRRRVLLARHKVVAARMAIGFTTVFTVGAFAVATWTGAHRPGYAAAATGAAMLTVAVAAHVRARRDVDRLVRRRAELERQLAVRGGNA